jgi:hypothetical protein
MTSSRRKPKKRGKGRRKLHRQTDPISKSSNNTHIHYITNKYGRETTYSISTSSSKTTNFLALYNINATQE